MTGPLAGLRVVELSEGLSVASCARQFAMWGAEVVRLVPPGEPSAPDDPAAVQRAFLDANKALHPFDARSDAGSKPLALIEAADVFLTDWTPARLAAAGLDLDDIARRFPALVVLAFSDFGRGGPYAEHQATDIVLQSLTGFVTFNGQRDREPLKAPANVLPHALGVSAFVGVLAALRARRAHGRGDRVEVSAMETMASLTQYTRTQYFDRPMRRHGGIGPPMLPCADGWLFFNYAIEFRRESLLFALEIDPSELPAETDALREFFAERTRRWRAQDLFERMSLYRATCAIVKDAHDLLADPHLEAREFFHDFTWGGDRILRFPGPPAKASATPALPPAPARPFQGWAPRPEQPLTSAAALAPDARPLEGLRVLDLTQAWLGPYAGMLLADLGADVIKVESPTRPDVWRGTSPERPPCARPGAHPWNIAHFFNSVNRNKRGLALDLDDPRGKELFLRLVRTADVLIENYTPRVMDNFGLGYDVLREVNPGLVMVSFSGYGKTGPYREFRAHGASIEVVAGWDSIFGYPDAPPMTMGEYQLDPMAGLHMAACALAGLLARDVTGAGQAIEGSMIEAAVGYIGDEVLVAQAVPGAPNPRGNRDRRMAPHGIFPSAGDDRWIAIAVRDDADWAALVSVVAAPALRDECYATLEGRLRHIDDIEAALSCWTAERSPYEAMAALQAAGVPAGAVQRTDEVIEDRHLAARDWFKPQHHADLGTHRYYGFPWSFSRARLAAHLPPVRLGEHSAEILRDELGLSDAEIEALTAARVTGAVLEAPEGSPAPATRARR